MEMDCSEYELYKAEYSRCPWDSHFKQTLDHYENSPKGFLEKLNG